MIKVIHINKVWISTFWVNTHSGLSWMGVEEEGWSWTWKRQQLVPGELLSARDVHGTCTSVRWTSNSMSHTFNPVRPAYCFSELCPLLSRAAFMHHNDKGYIYYTAFKGLSLYPYWSDIIDVVWLLQISFIELKYLSKNLINNCFDLTHISRICIIVLWAFNQI